MTATGTGVFHASKNGDIAAAKLIRESTNEWRVKVEKRELCVSKSDDRRRVFGKISEALQWSGADPDLLAHFMDYEFKEQAQGTGE